MAGFLTLIMSWSLDMKNSRNYIAITIILSLLSISLSYPKMDFVLVMAVLVINMFMKEIYNMNVRRRWHAGAGIVVDEVAQKNMHAMDLKKPLMAAYCLIIIFAVFGRLFMDG